LGDRKGFGLDGLRWVVVVFGIFHRLSSCCCFLGNCSANFSNSSFVRLKPYGSTCSVACFALRLRRACRIKCSASVSTFYSCQNLPSHLIYWLSSSLLFEPPHTSLLTSYYNTLLFNITTHSIYRRTERPPQAHHVLLDKYGHEG
jgi:hypothetical protein